MEKIRKMGKIESSIKKIAEDKKLTVEQKFDEIIPLICQYSRYNSYNRILGQEAMWNYFMLKVVDKRIIVVEKL